MAPLTFLVQTRSRNAKYNRGFANGTLFGFCGLWLRHNIWKILIAAAKNKFQKLVKSFASKFNQIWSKQTIWSYHWIQTEYCFLFYTVSKLKCSSFYFVWISNLSIVCAVKMQGCVHMSRWDFSNCQKFESSNAVCTVRLVVDANIINTDYTHGMCLTVHFWCTHSAHRERGREKEEEREKEKEFSTAMKFAWQIELTNWCRQNAVFSKNCLQYIFSINHLKNGRVFG